MKIGLLMAFAGRGCGGPEIFERELVQALLRIAPEHDYHLYCLDRRAETVIGLREHGVVYHRIRPAVRAVSMMTTLPVAIARTRPKIFHAPVIPPPFCPLNAIMAMPCSSLIRHPELYPPLIRMRLRFLLHRAIPRSSKVVCPSEHVRDVMRERFRLPNEKLPVIYPGVSPKFRMIGEEEKRTRLEQKYGIRFPYFMFCGRWEKRKNIIGTLKAFDIFKRSSKTEHKLVMSGGRSWNSLEAEDIIRRLGLQDDILDLGQESVSDLPCLYGGAEAVVYASLWEGFGMPILEAMACGTPVITSNVAAMPETAGGNALLVDPHSPEDIAAAMHRMATDAPLRARLRQQGPPRAKLFTWERTARKTLELYEELGEQRTAVCSARI